MLFDGLLDLSLLVGVHLRFHGYHANEYELFCLRMYLSSQITDFIPPDVKA